MPGPTWDWAVVGGGIVGLAIARELQLRTGVPVLVLEAESHVAAHQTSHNSGVVHAGLYYQPDSLRATLTRRSVGLLREYCAEHGLGYRAGGKIVVAANAAEEPALQRIFERAQANQVPQVALIGAQALRDIEPHVAGIAAVHSPQTAVVDFAAVARRIAQDIQEGGGSVRCNAPVVGMAQAEGAVRFRVGAGGAHPLDGVRARRVVLAAGLHSDRLAQMAGGSSVPAIVPVRGEYLRLTAEATGLVRSLIYPVPDPRHPFLGVHFTRHLDHSVTIGPNAVPALSRHGYGWGTVSPKDLLELLRDTGARKFFMGHVSLGAAELARALFPGLVVRRAQALVPELRVSHVERGGAGVRAQAVRADGTLVDDFVIEHFGPIVAIRNAPSPAATASLGIAEYVTNTLLG